MSGRRNRNAIRGPQSALTDFLASNNISAAQIRQDYEDRRRREEADAATAAAAEAAAASNADDDDIGAQQEEVAQTASSKKRKRAEDEVEKVSKKVPKVGKEKAKKKSKRDGSDYEDTEDEEFVRDMYKKARPAPGQMKNCEICSKRFTVTPYSVTGPDGGLLCTPCGKDLKKEQKKQDKGPAKPVNRKKRKTESDKLDGINTRGPKLLSQMCIEQVVKFHDEVDELGDLPQPLLEKLSAIFSKRRVLKPDTLALFLRPDLQDVVLHDAAYLEVNDYKQIFAVVPHIRKLALGNACQFKDDVLLYMAERCRDLKDIRIYAANLVSNEMWSQYFKTVGTQLETIKLKWLDATFGDDEVSDMITSCPNLQRLKLKFTRNIGEGGIRAIMEAKCLQHLTLHTNQTISEQTLQDLVNTLGANLRTLSLEKFIDMDDGVLQAIHSTCKHLSKLRLSENDTISDMGIADLFTDWPNPPLSFIDVNCTRDIDNNNPAGPEQAIGMASAGFLAMMAHSGSAIKHLDVASCRHINLKAFLDVFNGETNYPNLEYLNISFCNRVDTTVIAGIFKSCPALKKLVAFGCFDVGDVVVPRDIVLIGIPKAQDAVEQFGVGMDLDEALGRMLEAAA